MNQFAKGHQKLTQPSRSHITRRRSLQIIGSALLAPSALYAAQTKANGPATGKRLKQVSWQGIVLGSDASILLTTENETHAKTTIKKMLLEVKRLESYFSLYQKNSLINQLNINGIYKSPPKEFKELITEAVKYSKLSDGAFDPTIQPLFMAYKNLNNVNRSEDSIPQPSVKEAINLINWKNIEIANNHIAFKVPQMAITLNGIAQGYITDKAVEILKANGFENTLVNFGEYVGSGSKHPQQNTEHGWNIQLGKTDANETAPEIWNLKNNALAASSHGGYQFNDPKGLHHMLDPRTGSNQPAWREIYVLAETATKADAASTALFASPPKQIKILVEKLKLQKTLIIKSNGARLTI
ncbi:FAD:protein FMN transferase [Hyphomicrobiales bacterium 4NK60-0047b]